MSRFPPEFQMKRFRAGDVGYLRVRIVAGIEQPWGLKPKDAVALVLIDRKGNPISNTQYYVPESTIVSTADAFRAVKEALS